MKHDPSCERMQISLLNSSDVDLFLGAQGLRASVKRMNGSPNTFPRS
jgi:hypothetical protein